MTTNALLKTLKTLGYTSQMCSHGWRHFAVTSLKELRFGSDIIYLQMLHSLEKSSAKVTYDKAQLLALRKEMMQIYANALGSLR